MKRTSLFIALITVTGIISAAPWTYRGTLNDAGKPANGSYDLRLTLVNEAGTQSVTQPITLANVMVKDGNFAAEVDFGVDLSNAPAMELKTEGQQNGSVFASLGEPSAFDAKAALAGICRDTTGNVVAVGEFLGSTNNVPLVLKASNAEVLRIAGGLPNGTANIVAGSLANTAVEALVGQTIAGGENSTLASNCGPNPTSVCKNATSANYATVSGGFANNASGFSSTVIGGNRNEASAFQSTVSGGSLNKASEQNSTVSDGQRNTAAGGDSTVSGGIANVADGQRSAISGGDSNETSGYASVVSGGESNCAGGKTSWAGGTAARIRQGQFPSVLAACSNTPSSGLSDGDHGAFVWADRQGGAFTSTGPSQFAIRASGGLR